MIGANTSSTLIARKPSGGDQHEDQALDAPEDE